MEFNPQNPIVQLCIQGMAWEAQNKPGEAALLFLDGWEKANHPLEKFLAAWFLARCQSSIAEKRHWLQTALDQVLLLEDEYLKSTLPALYDALKKCSEEVGETGMASGYDALAQSYRDKVFDHGPFYHGTRADLPTGAQLSPGFGSNYKTDLVMNHIYFTASPNGAGLAAALAKGDGKERVYLVKPTGPYENDPNVTDKKFPGNLTRSYRTEHPLTILGEVINWEKQTPEQLRQWQDRLARNSGEIIN